MGDALGLLSAAVLGLAALIYIILDGYDLGVGMLFGTTRSLVFRRSMLDAIAPLWNGNQAWLIVIGVVLLVGFPPVFTILFQAFYLPAAVLALALLVRMFAGVRRERDRAERRFWDRCFAWSSLVAAFVQGAILGTIIDELPVEAGEFTGGPFEWLTPFAVMCGIGLILGYMLLGASWLVFKSEGTIRTWAYRRLPWIFGGVVLFLTVIFSYSLAIDLRIMGRWIERPFLFVFPFVGTIAAIVFILGIQAKLHLLPFAMIVLLFLSTACVVVISFWPYLIPFSVTIHEAMAPRSPAATALVAGCVTVLPAVCLYGGLLLRHFRPRIPHE